VKSCHLREAEHSWLRLSKLRSSYKVGQSKACPTTLFRQPYIDVGHGKKPPLPTYRLKPPDLPQSPTTGDLNPEACVLKKRRHKKADIPAQG
jgi:hypothetical protein